MNKRQLGGEKEQIAAGYLTQRGFVVKEMNYRVRQGEIDIVGMDQDTLVFCEVKYRKTNKAGFAADAVTAKKIRNICRVSNFYRMYHQIPLNTGIRYDVIAIDDDKINWIKNAFSYLG
ncbi:MAG: YraN family protein [Lachnospiraceae bacterium]|nr:YraN family protein [Lachnospiraceae bacterium]